ncbi:MAG: iviTM7 protein [Candidatus Parcubacteria bacterium]
MKRFLSAAFATATIVLSFATLALPQTASAAYCWCKTPNNGCENHVTQGADPSVPGSGKPIDTQDACNAYCASRGDGWKAVHYDETYTDYNGTAECGDPNAAGANQKPSPIPLFNPLGIKDINGLVARIIQIITGLSGSLALLMFVYGGFLWTTSHGNPEQVKKGKQMFINATLGLIVIFGAYALVNLVFSFIAGQA